MVRKSAGRSVPLFRCRRSSVALYIALLAPVLAAATGLGVEVSNWSVEQLRIQRAADTAAIAGALSYTKTGSAQSAATAAAKLAEINGSTGTASPTWDAGTKTLTDNQIKVQVVDGVRQSADLALKVSVQKSVPLTISRMFSSGTSVTVRADSTAELVPGAGGGSSGPQPCMFALRTTANGGTGISANGYINVNAPGCSLRSNSVISFSGGGTFTTAGLYAADSISIPAWVTISGGGKYPNSGVLDDPYSTNTTLQNTLAGASSVTGSNIACVNQNCGLPSSAGASFNGSYCSGQGTGSVTCYLKPGNYGNWTALGGGPYTFNMAAGLYVFSGRVDLQNNTTTNGTGVTIVTGGYFNGQNTFNFYVTAPSNAQAASTGGIAGVVLASATNTTISFSGNPQFLADGVVYFPNATFDGRNSPTLGSSSNTCLEIVAANILLSGSIYVKSNCSAVNAIAFGSIPGSTTYTAQLVR